MSNDNLLAWQNGTYRFKHEVLDVRRLTQPFGVDYTENKDYSRLFGMKGHNGLDFSALTGMPVYAADDGIVEGLGTINDAGYGLNARLYIYLTDKIRIACVYAHLKEIVKTGEVKAGDLIAHSNNSGFSTGPHLHFGVRIEVLNSHGWEAQDSKNGFLGYLDPAPLFTPTSFKLPVELRYGQPRDLKREASFTPSYLWFRGHFGRYPTQQEYNALVYGYWDIRTVIDAAMFTDYWSKFTKPAALKAGLIK